MGRPDWPQPPNDPHPDAAVWPTQLRANEFFRRQGNAFTQGRSAQQQEQGGDFYPLKELITDARGPDGSLLVRNTLALAYQYLIAATTSMGSGSTRSSSSRRTSPVSSQRHA
jgi:hypothetical protein